MAHISFFVPSLPAAHYLFAEVFGARKTRHRLDREQGEEWVDFLHSDAMGADQVSTHLDPEVRESAPQYGMAEIADVMLGRAHAAQHVHAALDGAAQVGAVKAPMPHWGPVYMDDAFEDVRGRLAQAGIPAQVQVHHAGAGAEHKTIFLSFGQMHLEIKGYRHAAAIAAGLEQ